jgi:acetylornithine/N-succinyldiaminopimelate aminotransferase
MALAKGLGGGFPVGACLATEEAASGMVAGTHGSTFGGNPLATAVVNAVLDALLAEGFLDGVQARANDLHGRLEALAARYPDTILEVRSAGMMVGLRTGPANGEFVGALRRQGLLAVPAGENVVRLLPPLVVDDSHVGEAVGMVEGACREFAAAAA